MAFHLKVITPRETLFAGEVESLQAPGAAGRLGILKDHAPLLALLKAGELSFQKKAGGAAEELEIGDGFLFVKNNEVIVLSD